MKKLIMIILLAVLMISGAFASDDGSRLCFKKFNYVAWSVARHCKVVKFIVWKESDPLVIQTVYVPLDIAGDKRLCRKYLRDAFSFDGTPVPTPTLSIFPTMTPTATATPDNA